MTEYLSKITRLNKLADLTSAVWFEKPTGFDFQPGQFINMKLKQDEIEINHCMTIASAPHEPELMIAARLTGSNYKNIFEKLKPDDLINFSEPLGNFVLAESTEPTVFIAGGIGVTPFRSMLKNAELQESTRRFFLFYFNKRKSGVAFFNELNSLQLENYKFIPVMTEDLDWPGETGYLTETLLKKYLDLEKAHYYVVGPPRMVNESVNLLKNLSVPSERIKSEEFTGYN